MCIRDRLRAIEVLESVREEGQDKAEWNMRMAYAYQYLHGPVSYTHLHHPYAITLLLKISDGFRTEEFCRLGLTGNSGDWERPVSYTHLMCIRDRLSL